MSFTAFRTKSQRDITHPPQFAVEGVVTTASNYGNKGGTSPTFASIGPGSTIKRGSNPLLKEVKNVGQQNRTQTVKIKEDHLMSVSTPITDNNIAYVKRFINAANGVGTADEALVHLKGFTIDATQYYEVYSGCIPSRGRIILDPDGFWMFEGECICQDIDQATSHGLTGTPVLITAENTDTPWKGSDAGGNSLAIAGTNYADFGMTIDVAWGHQSMRPSEQQLLAWMKPSMRTITGNIDIFVMNDALDNAAMANTAQAVTKVMKASNTTATLTDLVWDNAEGSDDSPENPESDIKSKGFSADNIALA